MTSTAPASLVDQVESTRDALRAEARRRLGVTGVADAPPLREALAHPDVSWYPLSALGVLAIVDTFQGYAFTVLTPEISRALGVGVAGIAAARALTQVALALAPLPMAALVQHRPRRAVLCVATALIWSVAAISTGFVASIWGLLAVLLVDGLTTASVGVLHQPLLMDSYPPPARVRVLSLYRAADSLGNMLAPLAVALLAASLGYTWRGVFVVLGVTSLVGTVAASRLRDPGFGRWDTEEIRRTVREHEHGAGAALDDEDVSIGFFEIVRRLLLIPTVRRILVGFSVFGVLTVPLATFLSFFLDERWNLGPGGRGVFVAGQAAASIAVLIVFGRFGERLFRRDPAKVIELAATLLAVAVTLIAVGALVPNFALMTVLMLAAHGLVTVLAPAFGISLLSVIPARMRPHATALSGLFVGAGGIAGVVLLSGIDRRFGIAGSMVAMVVPGIVGALIIRSTGKLVPADLDRMIDEVLEEEEVEQIHRRGERLPMLACRRIDFSYGPLQVLFDVDFTVDEGEMVALLGVNGAGKSTLLKVISGIGLPSAGSVRFRGHDITYLDAERRVLLGITQVPGGRAVFGPMSVVDNLRTFGYTLGRDRAAIDAALDSSFSAFPRLDERRNQAASTLSGGEQQMLGLAKAIMLRPRLLLIDELSLGLAPVIVGQLLEMVRDINAAGTAVVLVEQSVNIALSLVDHAYFMEKGEMRFDGRAADLLGRDDLLRAVFLDGAGARGAPG